MEELPQYNLIQAIDPSKVKVPISDRFAKLTLSSNKKQQAKNNEAVVPKRESISRNLLMSLSLENENAISQEERSSSNESGGRKNPLLRSESSKETDNNNYLTLEDENETMDPLNVTDDDSHTQIQLEEDLEALSQRIASMAVVSRPISLSSDSTDHLNEITQLVSTESQRSTSNEVNNLHIIRNITDPLKENNISLNSAISQKNHEQPYEMTDDEDEDQETEGGDNDEDEEHVITISDTSESHHDDDEDNMFTSLPSISQTSENLRLTCIKDSKAERVAAFLRDVSIERRVMEECGHYELNDTVDQIINNEAIDKIQETLVKSRQIASADTESMSADVDEEVTPKYLIDREKRLRNLNDLMKTNVEDTDILNESNYENNDRQITLKNFNRLANDETQDNTRLSDDDELSESDRTPKNSSHQYNSGKNNQKLVNDDTKLNAKFSLLDLKQTTNKSHFQDNSPKFYRDINKDPRRLACDETQINSEFRQTESNSNAKIHSNMKTSNHFNSPNRIQNIENDHRRLANDDTQINSDFPTTKSNEILKAHSNLNSSKLFNSPNRPANVERNNRRLANDETVCNIEETSEINALTDTSIAYDYSRDLKTPERNAHRLANDETKDNSPQSIASSSEVLSDSIHYQQSQTSVVSSSFRNISPTPQDSITILETDDEENEDKIIPSPHCISETDDEETGDHKKPSSRSSNSEENKKLSNSFHNEDTSSSSDDDVQMSQIQMSMASINISAKINIKIHIPQHTTSTDTSEDEHEEQNHVEDDRGRTESNQQTNEHSKENFMKPCNQLQSKSPLVPCLSPLEKSPSNSIEEVEDQIFLTEAEKLLTQLYGKSWQTPDVIRTLKHSSRSGESKSISAQTSFSKNKETKNKCNSGPKSSNNYPVEESILHDFSMFRRNIVRTNLDSTRLVTPKTATRQRLMKNKGICTEPRNVNKPRTSKEQEQLIPQIERTKIVVNKGRVNNDKWRQLLVNNSDVEENNASDDDDADESWSKNASEIENDNSDSDFENVPTSTIRNKKNNSRTKRQVHRNRNGNDNLTKQLNKSKEGDIVYLDLSKEEVEVQEDAPESPPANHDETFASRLQDILKTCRHEDKAKLPSSTTKTKRKLFTPMFGDDLEGDVPKDVPKQKETFLATELNTNNVLLDDYDTCPFDRQGRPKILDLVNKQLEAVKTGKPIFQLTPSPKKQAQPLISKNDKHMESATPKSKKEDKTIFKTPLTAKSKGPAKTYQGLCQTPDYKYSFLKSLDVTVSKSFRHPDALYYSDNYRTKKEDLSKILYEMYNDKLFHNKIDVPITWNKKLSNTAGRCLNKKKLGIRTSVIELSDKVLTSADRLRCTLIHELCHAATWIFNGEGGHGCSWKEWARKANATFPEIPKIGVCHQYDIEYKYTYKCTLCAAKSHAHSKSKKVENIRCSYCHGAIEIFLNKKDKEGNIMPTPVKEPTGFAKFVKDNYKKYKRDDLKHADVMKLLSSEFATLKLTTN